jgi:transcriptional regulator GlxA family with amidase domain/YHS domain-containing protein
MGPYQVLGEMMGVDVFFVGLKKGLIADGRGMKVQCDTSIADVKALDILVIPGGFQETYALTKDTTLLNWIKEIDKTSKYTTSVCTGAWILAATGLLKDQEATTHWYGKTILNDEFGIKPRDKRFVKSGKYWSSAGITAGMDMSLALINEILGENYTKTAMLDLEYDPQPPFKGGSEHNTDKKIVETLRTMYDGGMESVLHPETIVKNINFENQKDFICGMPLNNNIADTAVVGGKTYGFCSPSCKKRFSENPNKYLTKK